MAKSSKKRTHTTARTPEVIVGSRRTGQYPLTWLLVADGDEAFVYGVAPRTYRLTEIEGGKFSHDDLPGSVVKMHNRPHHKLDLRTNPHQETENTFLKHVANALDGMVREAGVEDLMVVAPPRAMAALRKELSRKLRKMVALEVTHEWINLPTYVMTRRLTQYLTGREPSRQVPREISAFV